MRQISSALLAHLQQATTSVCTCIRVTRRDGVVFGFTDLDADVTLGLLVYQSALSYSRSAISAGSDMSVDNTQMVGTFDSASLTAEDLAAGLFDFARVRIYAVNWQDLSMGAVILRDGVLGEVSSSPSGIFTCELRGLMQYLVNSIGEVYTACCRASLGDSRCKVALADPAWTKSGTITVIDPNNQIFIASDLGEPRAVADPLWWVEGTVSWKSGLNAGRAMEVSHYDPTTAALTLFQAMPKPVAVGDAFTITPGCDKNRGTCFGKFDNILNMRATPDVPGMETILRYPTG